MSSSWVRAWEDLALHRQALQDVHLVDLFESDPNRFSRFSLQVDDILFDYSKQRVTEETLANLIQWARASSLDESIASLFSGAKVNISEQRAALHTALRDPTFTPLMLDNQNIKKDIHRTLARMDQWVDSVRSGRWLSASHQKITDVISLGIGGSDLGPSMVCRALQRYKTTDLALHFVSNVDGETLGRLLTGLDPHTTLCIVNSKTFTTPETLENATTVNAWLSTVGQESQRQLIAVTANRKLAETFGIPPDNIFDFWDFVGGRYSVWSAVGLPIALLLGMSQFREFLAGAHAMDTHFRTAPFLRNMPVLMALIGIWNINFLGFGTLAVMPYEDGLEQLPAYLQQLEMESNGKCPPFKTESDRFMHTYTAPIIWGGVGCNGQHAYLQWLHQGSQIAPVDFLIGMQSPLGFEAQHQLLVASCLSQSKALMEGNARTIKPEDSLLEAKRCAGNRPSSTLAYSALTPYSLGALLALYEHKVFVQGVLWGINSFDQWGVELGKKCVKEILPCLTSSPQMLHQETALDSSTQGLIQRFQMDNLLI